MRKMQSMGQLLCVDDFSAIGRENFWGKWLCDQIFTTKFFRFEYRFSSLTSIPHEKLILKQKVQTTKNKKQIKWIEMRRYDEVIKLKLMKLWKKCNSSSYSCAFVLNGLFEFTVKTIKCWDSLITLCINLLFYESFVESQLFAGVLQRTATW